MLLSRILSFIHIDKIRLIDNRAVFNATAAPGAKIHLNVACPFTDAGLQIPFLTRNAFHFCKGKQFNINVPADLDQFRRDNSHGTVIGRKGLVKLRHHTTDGTGFFHKVDIIAGIGQIQGSLHAGNPAAHHHYGTCFFICHCLLLSQKKVISQFSQEKGLQGFFEWLISPFRNILKPGDC
jgi:hypothetical protein